jgi:S-adenosylmethionine decarboxylase
MPSISGCEWVIEAHGCDEKSLRDQAKLARLFDSLIDGMSLHAVADPSWHKFPGPGGITGLCLLAESHLACHTFPEYHSMCLNIFCCRPRPDWDFAGYLKTQFAAVEVSVRKIDRPYGQS